MRIFSPISRSESSLPRLAPEKAAGASCACPLGAEKSISYKLICRFYTFPFVTLMHLPRFVMVQMLGSTSIEGRSKTKRGYTWRCHSGSELFHKCEV